MTRRYPGHGSIDQLPSGRHRVRVRDTDGKQHTLGTYPTEEEAAAVLASAGGILTAARQQAKGTGEPRTLAAWGTTHFTARERDGIRSVASERSVWARYVERDPIGAVAVRDVTRALVVAWMERVRGAKVLRSVRGKGLAPTDRTISVGTMRHALHVLRSALHTARDAGHLVGDPTDGVHVPRAKATGAKAEVWTWLRAPEVAAVTSCAAYDLEHRAIYATAIYTGLRQGELWALRWASVTLDGDAPEVLVCESHDGPPKNGKARRVPLLPAVLELLRAWRATFAPELPDGALVFPGESGGRRGRSDDARWSPQTRYTRADGSSSPVAGYRTRAGVTRRVRFHDLRHTCASHLLQGTWGVRLALVEVRDWLGHSSIDQTERYAHLCPDRLAARIARDSREGASVSHGGEGVSQNPLPVARPRGVEPLTLGSEVPRGATQDRGVTPGRDSGVTPEALQRLARVVLGEVAASGRCAPETALALARAAIVEGIGGRWALDVLDGGPLVTRAALELAVEVIGRGAAGLGEARGGRR